MKTVGWIFVSWLCAGFIAGAEDRWSVTTADFHRASVVVVGIDAGGLKVVPVGGAEAVISMDRVLRLERDVAARPGAQNFTLFFQNGDRLAGTPGDLKDEVLAWSSPVLGELKIELSKIRGISRLSLPPDLDAIRKEDQITLSNHDAVRGIIAGLEDGKIQIQTGGETVAVPLASADSVLFAAGAKPLGAALHVWRVRFTDSSVLSFSSVALAAGKLQCLVAGEKTGQTRSTDLENVMGMDQMNGPVSWLSDREPVVNQQVPFNSESTYPARMNLNVFGKPLRAGGQVFERGIGVHANSVLAFPLDGTYRTFRTRYAIDTTGDVSKAAVHVRILLDGKVVHEAADVRAYVVSPVVSVNLGNAKELRLEVTAAGATDTQDRLDWIEGALVREAQQADR